MLKEMEIFRSRLSYESSLLAYIVFWWPCTSPFPSPFSLNAVIYSDLTLSLTWLMTTASLGMLLFERSGYGAVLVKHTGVITRYRRAVGLNPVGVIPVWVDMLQATGASHFAF